jgi:co-chaperonin GroES (HSP10)
MIKPLRDYVLLKKVENQAERFFGNIYIPEMASTNPKNQVAYVAEVKAHGPKVEHATTGKTVWVSEYVGRMTTDEGILCKESDLLGVIE